MPENIFLRGDRTFGLLFFSIIAVYAVTVSYFISTQSVTADEPLHLRYGIQLLKGDASKQACTLQDSKLPVSALNALPRAFQQLLHPGLQKSDEGRSDVIAGRWVTVFFSLLVLLLVFQWSKELYNKNAGLFSMGLLALCPNWLAHSGLVTTDAYASLIALIVFYLFYKYYKTKRFLFFVLFCVAVGLAQLVKQTFIYLYLCLGIITVLYAIAKPTAFTLKKFVGHGILFILISLIVINAGFLFHQTGQSLSQYHFVSNTFQQLQEGFGWAANLPLPLPSPFLVGIDTVTFFDEYGGGTPESSFPAATILYHSEPGKAYWYFYPLSFLFKTPIPTLAFIVLSLVFVFKSRNRSFLQHHEFFVLTPVLFFFTVISFFYHIQVGIRHLLFLYPFLYIVCGKLLYEAATWRKLKPVLLVGLCWLMGSVYYYHNAFLSYTNEFVLDKTNAFRLVGAANIDYGQAYDFAKAYITNNPGTSFAPNRYQPGTFLIPPGDYLDDFGYHTYNWIQQYPPVGTVKFCYLIVKVP